MKRNTAYTLIISCCIWAYMSWNLYASTSDTADPLATLTPVWDALVRSGPFAVLTGLICRWFMSHIDKLVTECREERQELLKQIFETKK